MTASDDRVGELLGSGIRSIARALRQGRVTSVELTEASLDRLATIGPDLNAVAEITGDLALFQAQAADRRRAGGRSRSSLDGIPYGAKDLLATAGIPTRWGAPPFQDQVFDRDATVIARLHDSGAVLVAKLSLVELCGAGGYRTPDASLHGPGRNPWDRSRWSGGSSSGSAAAVAAQLVPFAIGSDTSGSITGPAAYCGITGLRPSWGGVSLHGACPVAWSMDTIGPMARSADDCADVLAAIAGRDKDDPYSLDVIARSAMRRPMRIGIPEIDFDGTPTAAERFFAAIATLGRIGHTVVDVKLPDIDETLAQTIMNSEAAVAHAGLIQSGAVRQLVSASQADGLEAAASQSMRVYVDASAARRRAVTALARIWDEIDVVAAPTRLHEAPAIDDEIGRWPRGHGRLAALAGLPTLSVPMGPGPAGMPLGLIMFGPRGHDLDLLRLGSAFQRATDWHRLAPSTAHDPRATAGAG